MALRADLENIGSTMNEKFPKGLGLLLMLALGSSSCFLDFESFPTEEGTTTPDAGDMNQPDQAEPDMGGDSGPEPDMAEDADMAEPSLAIGAACTESSECGGEKECLDGFCTQSCAEDVCPEGSQCSATPGAAYCVASCELQECANEALSCVSASAEGVPTRLCLPDPDADGTSDYEDNCPDDANPRQEDADADGVGDACDEAPLCFGPSVDGVLDFGPIDLGRENAALPNLINSPQIPLIGGQSQGLPSADVDFLDLRDGTLTPGQALHRGLYDARSFAFGTSYLATPGAAIANDVQAGRFNRVSTTQTTPFEYFSRSVYEPHVLTLENGEIWVVGWQGPRPEASWQIMEYNRSNQTFTLRATGSFADRERWHAGRTQTQRGFFYHVSGVVMRIYFVEPNSGLSSRSWLLPDGLTHPFMVPGENGNFWVFDRLTGNAFRTDEFGTIVPVPELNQTWPAGATEFISMESSQSFVVLSRDTNSISGRVISLSCLPAAAGLDADADGVSDIIDNCREAENADQSDLDGDGYGDACDPDIDGDSISNDADVVPDPNDELLTISRALDTDNDGVDNVDDPDIDGDGIPNETDRFPLDSDNDGIINALDPDDDGDGYLDFQENSVLGLSTNPLAFPNSGRIVWVKGEGNSRGIEYLELGTQDVTEVNIDDGPSLPRWHTASSLVVLNGAVGQTNEWSRVDLNSGIVSATTMPGELFGVDPASTGDPLEAIAATMILDGEPTIVLANLLPSVSINPIFAGFETISEPDYNPLNGSVVYAGGDSCVGCLLPYRTISNITTLVTSLLEDVRSVRANQLQTIIVAKGTETATSAWRVTSSTVEEFVPPGIVEVQSAVGMDADTNVLVLGQTESGTSQIWLYNRRTSSWWLVHENPMPLRDIDWIR